MTTQKTKTMTNKITVFTVFRLLTDFVCLYNYEFGLFLCNIVRSSVILLLPLLQFKHYSSKHNHNMHCIILITDKWRVFDIVPPYNFPMFSVKSRSFCKHINSFANYKTYLAIIIRRFGLFVPKI